jgi:plastocyanin
MTAHSTAATMRILVTAALVICGADGTAARRLSPVRAPTAIAAELAARGRAREGSPAGPTTDLAGVVRSGGRPQAEAVVWLDAPDASPSAPRRAVLDQRNLTFEPHVLVVRVGTTVELPNNDRVFHNVFSFHDGKRFDLGLYPAGTSKRIVFDRPGLSRVFCNIHPGMAAYVLAVDTPYFAVSDAEGRFSIRAVPRGAYTYHAWRPGGRTITGTIAAVDEAPFEVALP